MRIIRLSACLLALVLALAGCGTAGLPDAGPEPPTAGALVADSVEALMRDPQSSARFDLRIEAKPTAAGPAAMLLGDRLSLEIEGAASAKALVAGGKAEVAGESFEGEIRAGDGFYIRVGDTWYGTPDGGPFEGSFSAPSAAESAEALAALRAIGDDLFDGQVEPGPEIGGDETWRVKGTINPDALVELGRRIGEPLSPEDEALLREHARRVDVEYAVGRDDSLPRRIAFSGSVSKSELPADLAEEVPIEALELQFALELSDWGAPVEVEAPERYTSFEELLGSFFAGSGLEVQLGPSEGPSAPPEGIALPEAQASPPPELQAAPPPEVQAAPAPDLSVPPPELPVPHP